MRAHFLFHVKFEGPGNIEPWLRARGFEITATHFYKSEELPQFEKIDLLIIMGGPMSVNDEEHFPWLLAEKKFILACIKAGKKVLGICLGSQLIASVLDASVYRNPEKEIGWFPVQGITSSDPSVFRFPLSFPSFHWHGETFHLPPGAVQIARSEACENQAFQIGRSVVGLQFHLETTPGSLKDMITRSRSELVSSAYVQSESEIIGVEPGKYQLINKLMGEVLAFLINRPGT